tara:strand:- start:807 stop:2393 length:1587 start_codon:yes stop_codon:yes gene_type:complete
VNSEHIEAYLAGELDETSRRRVERVLRDDRALRESFLHQLRINTALEVVLGGQAAEHESHFDDAVMARLKSEGADGHQGFSKSVLTEIVEEREGIRPLRWPDLIKAGVISAAASIALMFFLQSIIFRDGLPERWSSQGSAPTFVARIEASDGVQWAPSTEGKIRKDGWLTPGLLEIDAGQTKIAFNSGATATVEGPALLSIESTNRLFLKKGRLTADVPKPAIGFTVNTPRLNAVDLGTRFGISVEPNGDSELHVMEGLVEASRTRGNSVATLVREGLAVRADSRTRSQLAAIPYRGEAFVLTLGASGLPQPALRYTFDESDGGSIEDSGVDRLFDVPLVASGEMENSPRRGPGYSSGGLVFRDTEFLEVPLSREFRLNEQFTIGFWLKIAPRIGRDGETVLVQYGREELGWTLSCNLNHAHPSKGALRVDHGNGYIVGTTDIADGNWHHVTCRFIGGDEAELSSHLHLFVDGQLESLTDTQSGTIETGRVGQLRIGGDSASQFEGWVDELNLFREAVPTLTIQELSK